MIKLIAIDLDGTLFNPQGIITEKNKEAIKSAKELGVKVVICTGRPLAAIRYVLEDLGLTDEGDYSITFNGGLVQKNDTGEILKSHTLSISDVKEVHELMYSLDLPVDAISDDTCYHVMPTPVDYPSLYETFNAKLKYAASSIMEMPQHNMYNKMVVANPSDHLDEKIALLPDWFYEKFSAFKSRPTLLEIMNPSVTKANGMKDLGESLGIDRSEMMAIGDEENDLSMIEFSGLGVAMGNAVKEVKDIAQFISKSNEEDGVAFAIEKYVIKK